MCFLTTRFRKPHLLYYSSKGVREIDWYVCKQTSSSTENARYELMKLLKIDGITKQKFISRWDNVNFIKKDGSISIRFIHGCQNSLYIVHYGRG